MAVFLSQNKRGPTTKVHDVFLGAKTEEDLQQEGTIYISEPKFPKGTIIRHDTIIRLLLVSFLDGSTKTILSVFCLPQATL